MPATQRYPPSNRPSRQESSYPYYRYVICFVKIPPGVARAMPEVNCSLSSVSPLFAAGYASKQTATLCNTASLSSSPCLLLSWTTFEHRWWNNCIQATDVGSRLVARASSPRWTGLLYAVERTQDVFLRPFSTTWRGPAACCASRRELYVVEHDLLFSMFLPCLLFQRNIVPYMSTDMCVWMCAVASKWGTNVALSFCCYTIPSSVVWPTSIDHRNLQTENEPLWKLKKGNRVALIVIEAASLS